MPEMSRSTKKQFVVISNRDQAFRSTLTLASTNVPQIAQIVAWLPRLGTITPVEMDITYGMTDDPNDGEGPEFFFALVDVDNIPDIASLRSNSLWTRAQRWQILSSVGFAQMLNHDVIDWFNPKTYNYSEVNGFTRRTALCVLVSSNNTSSIVVQGSVTWVETLTQRVWSSSGVEGELSVEAEESADF